MAAATTTAIIAGTLMAGAMTKQTVDARKARKEATAKSDKQEYDSQVLQQEAEKRSAEEESKAAATATRDKARARQKALNAGAQGRAGTILTSPLGTTGAPQTAGKTLLGS